MSQFKVFVTREIPRAGLDLLGTRCEFTVGSYEEKPLAEAEIRNGLKGADALLCLLTERITREILSDCHVKIVANAAVGYDNIDVKAATELGIPVTNTPGVLTETTADFAFSLLMSSARRIAEADRFVRAGKFTGWGMMMLLGNDVYGKTLGIVGMGRIGRAVAKRGKGFGMKIVYTDQARNPEAEAELGAEFVSKETLFRSADFVSLHVPLTPETRHFVGAAEFALMKPTSHLINTARGPVVDEQALLQALKDRKIAGAGLDVYEREPQVTAGLMELDNVTLAPHLASASVETRSRMATMAVENIFAVMDGRRPPNLVNPDVYAARG
ncbi:MAG: D-glycerate dehydrogenase [Firmicutes bacterium]|nr:D-glycerate dehydrogenase [Bacillota bacterium]